MPYRWTAKQRQRSHRTRELLLLLVSLTFTAIGFFMVFDDSATETRGELPSNVAGILVVVFFGAGSIVFTVLIVAGARSARTSRHRVRSGTMRFDPRKQPQMLAIQQGWMAGIPIASGLPDDAQPRHRQGGRVVDWMNAGSWIAMGWAVPVVGLIANRVFDQSLVGEFGLFMAGVLGLAIGSWLAWDAWHGELDSRSLRVNPEHTTLTGRTGWPMKRWRTLRLDQLARIRCRQLLSGHSIDTYFLFRDAHGTKAMVEDTPRVRAVLLAAVATQPGVRVSRLASRQLADMFTWWSPLLAFFKFMVHLAIVVGSVIAIAGAFGTNL